MQKGLPSHSALVIFTDGACSGNPGRGGWGAIIAFPEGIVREIGRANPNTTNNQMELTAVIEALREVQKTDGPVSVFTDSTYVIRGITQWIWAWKKRGWKTAEGKDVANQELWKTLSALVAARDPKPEWHYVRGHVGTPGNERVDEIAVGFTQGRYVDLYDGPLLKYPVPIYDLPEDTSLPEMRPKETKAAAQSYLSLVNGVPEKHATWKECEARVKGRSGARFKKAMNDADEAEILAEWGYSEKDLKS